ncbi:MAG: Maf family protein [Sulfuriferula sp.]
MAHNDPRIYLASRSPRRRELLRQIGVQHEVLLLRESSGRLDLDETPQPDESPQAYAIRIASAKADVGWQRVTERQIPRYAVLGADTTVALDGEIFGKPLGLSATIAMLGKLAGRSHQVLTAVALTYEARCEVLLSTSTVKFKPLSEREIHAYAVSGEPFDKAGGYAIQGRAATFIEHLEGSYSGVMGLPLFETAQLLQRFNLKLFE